VQRNWCCVKATSAHVILQSCTKNGTQCCDFATGVISYLRGELHTRPTMLKTFKTLAWLGWCRSTQSGGSLWVRSEREFAKAFHKETHTLKMRPTYRKVGLGFWGGGCPPRSIGSSDPIDIHRLAVGVCWVFLGGVIVKYPYVPYFFGDSQVLGLTMYPCPYGIVWA